MIKKLLAVAVLAGLMASTTACSDLTGPQPKDAGFCTVTGSGQTC